VLVIQSWEEDRVFLISNHVIDISEISSWSDPVLSQGGID
jgi:hypothetical protein